MAIAVRGYQKVIALLTIALAVPIACAQADDLQEGKFSCLAENAFAIASSGKNNNYSNPMHLGFDRFFLTITAKSQDDFCKYSKDQFWPGWHYDLVKCAGRFRIEMSPRATPFSAEMYGDGTIFYGVGTILYLSNYKYGQFRFIETMINQLVYPNYEQYTLLANCERV